MKHARGRVAGAAPLRHARPLAPPRHRCRIAALDPPPTGGPAAGGAAGGPGPGTAPDGEPWGIDMDMEMLMLNSPSPVNFQAATPPSAPPRPAAAAPPAAAPPAAAPAQRPPHAAPQAAAAAAAGGERGPLLHTPSAPPSTSYSGARATAARAPSRPSRPAGGASGGPAPAGPPANAAQRRLAALFPAEPAAEAAAAAVAAAAAEHGVALQAARTAAAASDHHHHQQQQQQQAAAEHHMPTQRPPDEQQQQQQSPGHERAATGTSAHLYEAAPAGVSVSMEEDDMAASGLSGAAADLWEAQSISELGGYLGAPAPLPRGVWLEASDCGAAGGRRGGAARGTMAARRTAATRGAWRALSGTGRRVVDAAPGLVLSLPSPVGQRGGGARGGAQEARQQRDDSLAAAPPTAEHPAAAGQRQAEGGVPELNPGFTPSEACEGPATAAAAPKHAPAAAAAELPLAPQEAAQGGSSLAAAAVGVPESDEPAERAAAAEAAAQRGEGEWREEQLPAQDASDGGRAAALAPAAAAAAAAAHAARAAAAPAPATLPSSGAGAEDSFSEELGAGELEAQLLAEAAEPAAPVPTSLGGGGAAGGAEDSMSEELGAEELEARLLEEEARRLVEAEEEGRMRELALLNRWSEHSVSARQVWHAAGSNPVDAAFLDTQPIVHVNLALRRLAEWKLEPEVRRLSKYALARADRNEHTYAAVFASLADVGRGADAVAAWEQLASAGVDVGPVGASGIIKACARSRDVASGLRIFEQMLRRRVTFNRYTYNGVLHLCAVMGRADDALAVYNLMRLETDPNNLPDQYTYAALVRAVITAKRYEMAGSIFENMLEDDVVPDSRLACHMIAAAGRARDVRLARAIYSHAAAALHEPPPPPAGAAAAGDEEEGEEPAAGGGGGARGGPAALPRRPGAKVARSLQRRSERADAAAGAASARGARQVLSIEVVNALLNAHALDGDLPGALRVYRQELSRRAPALSPDAFTFSSLLAAAGRGAGARGLPLAVVEGLRGMMEAAGVRPSGVCGSALINAYRRVRGGVGARPGEGDVAARGAGAAAAAAAAAARVGGRTHPEVAAAISRARGVFDDLRRRKLANSQVYAVMGAFLFEQGQADAAAALVRAAEGAAGPGAGGAGLGWKAYDLLARAAEDGALLDAAIALRARADRMREDDEARRGGGRPARGGGGGGCYRGGGGGGARGRGMAAGYSVRPGRPGER